MYARTWGSRFAGALDPKAITPMPFSAAMSYVEFCRAASQMGGWGFWNGLGRTCREGTCQKRPSQENQSDSQILGIMVRDSSHMSRPFCGSMPMPVSS